MCIEVTPVIFLKISQMGKNKVHDDYQGCKKNHEIPIFRVPPSIIILEFLPKSILTR